MTLKTSDLVIFQERENFQGKKERLVIVDCKNCPKYTGVILKNTKCIQCFLAILHKIKGKKFESLSLGTEKFTITKDSIELFLEYFKKTKQIKDSFELIDFDFSKGCIKNDMGCVLFSDFYSGVRPAKIDFHDPIGLFELIQMRYKLIKSKEVNNAACFTCQKELKAKFTTFLRVLKEQRIINEYITFCKKHNQYPSYLRFHRELFSTQNISSQSQKKTKKDLHSKERFGLIDNYLIGEHQLFKIRIYDTHAFEKLYEVNLTFQTKGEEQFFKKIAKDVKNHLIDSFKIEGLITFEELIQKYKNEGIDYISGKYHVSDDEKERISLLATFDAIDLAKLFPFLIDDFIEEIFLDSDISYVYINHRIHGRCRTDIRFNENEIERLKTFCRFYSGQRLDYSNPSIKFVMKNNLFFCRIAVDIAPIHASGFSLDIRKLNKNIFTIQDLVQNNTLNPLIASFLYFNILKRNNITVTGETDTGKTTLINALDLIAPKEFRKIYIENAIESSNQDDLDKHQLKYKVDSLDDDVDIKYSKSNLIKKLLHRSPDIIYLGEILTEEEAKAMFHCLSAGLRGFQTIHCNNIESLINRFLHHFKIDSSCFNDLDLIVLMKKDSNTSKRKVIQVAEINSSGDIDTLFQYNPDTDDWDALKGENLYDCKAIQKLTKHEKLDKQTFWRYLNIYKQFFEMMAKIERYSKASLVEVFDEISFISKFGLQKLERFWNDWESATRK